MIFVYLLIGLLVIGFAILAFLLVRWSAAKRVTNKHWQKLSRTQSPPGQSFDPAMLAVLPEPVQRFFNFSIKPGTPLYRAAEIQMRGTFSFGASQGYQALSATQILHAPQGMIWSARIGSGLRSVSGSDGVFKDNSWTQFALSDLIPVVQVRDDPDHYYSAIGRMLAESLFWTPAALLSSVPVTWEAVGSDSARAIISHGKHKIIVDLELQANGQASQISFLRWSNANADKIYRSQPFGGYLSEFQEFDGITVSTRVEAGNFFATTDYFPFYRVDVQKFQWLDRATRANFAELESVKQRQSTPGL